MPTPNARLEQLKAEHRALEQKLHKLSRHLHLSPEEQVETARLKKLKLAAKDEIMRLGG